MGRKLAEFFRFSERGTSFGIEVVAGLTTFATMAYIIFLQPAIMSGQLFNMNTGMDFNALLAGTCVAAAFGSILMGLLANYPIALAPGMGENFFFVLTALPLCATVLGVQSGTPETWQLALGVVFVSGVIFALLSFLNLRKLLINAVSPSMKAAIAAGIGLFIAFIGLKNGGLVNIQNNNLSMNHDFRSVSLLVFLIGLAVTGALQILKVRGGILWGILVATFSALLLQNFNFGFLEFPAQEKLLLAFPFSAEIPSLAPVFAQMDIAGVWTHLAQLAPLILIFTFMDVFDTLGTMIGVGTQAGLIKDNRLPNAERAFAADAIGTVGGAVCGHSTVTSYIESAAGVEHGGRTGLVAVVTGLCFLAALFCSPLVAMVTRCPAVTAPALVIVGAMMIRNVTRIDWDDYSEALPSFLVLIGIPFTSSIGDGMVIGFIAYPVIKILSGRPREAGWLSVGLGALLVIYLCYAKT
ncbi:MAG: hypothetical protein A2X49_03820 [Lentisphaerae bacterium GWF2_52_8]|nr:MAG: hypothetical protein A2X49_03820 [Lentisphaerae bacterium GWF2_52_8]